ncbi:PP2C family serine/threonine-protein phosphatase [Cupriavidus oxalaticus]|nr:PP2C family serine/threonine-protein phosphatase [Cupriavidus oxalaticus]
MWKVVSASAVGTSHTSNGAACQDTCFVDVMEGNDCQKYLVCLVSDGAGSAVFAEEGSDLACSTAMESIEVSVRDDATCLGLEATVSKWVTDVQAAISAVAVSRGATPRDFACTLLGAVIGEDIATFFQIGDGAIVVSNGEVQGVVFWPEAGPYANMTHFVTDADACSSLQSISVTGQMKELALFSDGLQRLALSFETKLPHHPFFEPMFRVLRTRTPDECDGLSSQLIQFLCSPQVNERTDDDKTLVLATRQTE